MHRQGEGRGQGGAKQGGGKQGGKKKGGGGGGGNRRAYPFPKSAWEVASIILGCPTANSVEMTIHPKDAVEAFVEFGYAGKFSSKSATQSSMAGSSNMVTLEGLRANTEVDYRLRYRAATEKEFKTGPTYQFHTQRPTGANFVFEVQGDSHPERWGKMHEPQLYERALVSAAADRPDFFICLGDDFSVDTLNERTKATVDAVYEKQVPYLGLVGKTAPVFLVNGNHEQAAKANLDGTPNSLGVLAQTARNRNFAQPAPDKFYSGNEEPVEHIGLLRNYFAWTWGDALFVTIDPYWHSTDHVDNRPDGGSKRRDLWSVTLGDKQYHWLKKTLETSTAKFKFVFAHHVLGTGRGGVERAPFFEWGGKGQNGRDEFAARRPGWELPIHQLMVKNGVTIFFQGHDHIYCKQDLDGMVYQSTPVPADANYALMNGDAYTSGVQMPASGRLRVTVGPEKTKVEYVRAYLPQDETETKKHNSVAHSYEVTPRIAKK